MFFLLIRNIETKMNFIIVLSPTITGKKHYHSFHTFSVNKTKHFEVTEMNSGGKNWLIQVLNVALSHD